MSSYRTESVAANPESGGPSPAVVGPLAAPALRALVRRTSKHARAARCIG